MTCYSKELKECVRVVNALTAVYILKLCNPCATNTCHAAPSPSGPLRLGGARAGSHRGLRASAQRESFCTHPPLPKDFTLFV